MALFQEWNSSRFADQFYVNRKDLMLASKIGSKSTYHRCITNLHSWGYLLYFPSNNPYKGSKIKMSQIGTEDEPDMGQYDPILEQLAEQYRPIRRQAVNLYRPTNGQALVSSINNNKQININKQLKACQVAINFFIEKGSNADEGKKFFDHYKNSNWKTSDGKKIRNWHALAINWMDRSKLYNEENLSNEKSPFQIKDNLRTTKTKDYGQPL